MTCLLGIDVGTSGAKAVLMESGGAVLAVSRQGYAFDIPREGWAEQDPEVWWSAVRAAAAEVLRKAGTPPSRIAGIGFSGQTHGLVPMGKDGNPVRKAIIWCDRRSAEQVEKIKNIIGADRLGAITGSPAAAGFQTASLLWMKENEPDLYAKTSCVLLPKDYARYRMTGQLSTDVTDAAGTLALDVRRGSWSEEILNGLGLDMALYPPIFKPDSPAGAVTPAAAEETGLEAGTPVFHGGADQVMQAIGNGIIAPGQVSVNIGTGAQVLSPLPSPSFDKALRSHTFNYYRGWYFMGAMLAGGLSLSWLREKILSGMTYKKMDGLAEAVPCGSEGLLFLPYLAGERTPHMDPYARGMFFGLQLNHTAAHMIRSVMEGVVFALKDCLSVFYDIGGQCDKVIASGGGAKSALWLQMQADILNRPVYTSQAEEQAGVGAAISASVGAGIYKDYPEACASVIKWNSPPCLPVEKNVKRYEEYYELFRSLYAANADIMRRCAGV